jgi:hypothetical protein
LGSAFGCEPRRGNGSRDGGSHFLFVLVFRQLVPSLRVLSWYWYVSTQNYRVFTRSLGATLVPATEQAV